MNKSRIEWTDFTTNPVKGLCPVACEYCYARAMYKRFKWNSEITFRGKMALLNELLKIPRDKPQKIFVGSTFELFGDWVKPEWMQDIFELVNTFSFFTFIFLTKQPQNLIKYSPYPENCWIGFTATNPDMFNKGLRYISEIKASVKFVSLEPLLDWNSFIGYNAWELLSWVIVGAQTPYNKRTFPKWEWIEKIIRDCDKCNTLVFLKNNLGLPKYSCEGGLPFYKPVGGTMVLRQELPYKVKEVMKHD